jgi:hypothetical protein
MGGRGSGRVSGVATGESFERNPDRRRRMNPWKTWGMAAVVAYGVASTGARAQEGQGDQEKAIAEIQKAGGKVERDEKAPEKPVTTINLATSQATDETLAHLKPFDKLQKLTLNNRKITDEGLKNLSGLTGLQKLYLVDTPVTDAGLEHLKGLTNLQVLSLVGTQVTDAGLEHLKGFTSLQEVFLYATKVTDDGAKAFKEAAPKVKVDR